MEWENNLLLQYPAKETWKEIRWVTLRKEMLEMSKHILFLRSQQKELTIKALTTSLAWPLQLLLRMSKMERQEAVFIWCWNKDWTQDQMQEANLQEKNWWEVDSSCRPQMVHIETYTQTLIWRFSFAGKQLSMIIHNKADREGKVEADQIGFAQGIGRELG